MKNPVPVLTKTAYTPWKVDLSATFTGSRRVRKFFATREDADMFLARVRMDGLRRAEQRPAAQVFRPEEFKREPDPGAGDQGPTMAELCAAFLGHHLTRVSAVSMRQLRFFCRMLERDFGRRRIGGITHREMESWILQIAEGASRFNAWRVSRRVFDFAVSWLEVIPRNPMRRVPRPETRKAGALPEILTPQQFDEALAVAEQMREPVRARWLAYLALGGLAGLRTAEILGVKWEDVNLDRGEIFVRQPKRTRGWMPRYVKILPRFAKVWKMVKKPIRTRGHGFDLNVENPVAGGTRYLQVMRRDAVALMGWTGWPRNGLRHSYGTYHLAHFKNLAELRGEMGHESEGVTRRHYATAARGVDAAAWWEGEGKG